MNKKAISAGIFLVLQYSILAQATPLLPKVAIWPQENSTYIETQVTNQFPNILTIEAARMTVVCPKWNQLPQNHRVNFWSTLVSTIAYFESSDANSMILVVIVDRG